MKKHYFKTLMFASALSMVSVAQAADLSGIVDSASAIGKTSNELQAAAGEKVYVQDGEHLKANAPHQLWGKTVLSSDAHVLGGKVDSIDFILGDKSMDINTMQTTFMEWKALISEKTNVKPKSLKKIKTPTQSKVGYSWDLGSGKYMTLTAEQAKVRTDGKLVDQLKQMKVSVLSKGAAMKFVKSYNQLSSPSKSKPVAKAPQNAVVKALKNLKVLQDGKYVDTKLTKPNAKYYAIYYSASWCPPCRGMAASSVKKFNETIKNSKNVEVIMAASCNSDQALLNWAKQESFPWPTLLPGERKKNTLVNKFNPRGIPHMAILDDQGNLVKSGHAGAMWQELLKLAEK